MITNINGFREQTPDVEENWLYQETEGDRVFVKYAALAKTAEPYSECTDAEKASYEAQRAIDHPEQSPEPEQEPEPEQ